MLHDFVERWKTSGVDKVWIADCMTWHELVEDWRVEGSGSAYDPCAAPFHHGCIPSDGTVVPCCLDLDGKMPLGNIAEKKSCEIWGGNEYRRPRLAILMEALAPGSICDDCDNTIREA